MKNSILIIFVAISLIANCQYNFDNIKFSIEGSQLFLDFPDESKVEHVNLVANYPDYELISPVNVLEGNVYVFDFDVYSDVINVVPIVKVLSDNVDENLKPLSVLSNPYIESECNFNYSINQLLEHNLNSNIYFFQYAVISLETSISLSNSIDTTIYNYINRDTIVYNVIEKDSIIYTYIYQDKLVEMPIESFITISDTLINSIDNLEIDYLVENNAITFGIEYDISVYNLDGSLKSILYSCSTLNLYDYETGIYVIHASGYNAIKISITK